MNVDVLRFFDQNPAALSLYETFEKRVLEKVGEAEIKAQKTQISFYHKHMFACVSFAKVRKAKERPETYIVVTFGLSHKVESPRIDVATEPYPGRWTHHVLIASEEEIDEELLGWVKETEAFAVRK